MLKIIGGFAALFALCYMMADKEQIPIERKKVDRWAKPLFFFVALPLLALMVFF